MPHWPWPAQGADSSTMLVMAGVVKTLLAWRCLDRRAGHLASLFAQGPRSAGVPRVGSWAQVEHIGTLCGERVRQPGRGLGQIATVPHGHPQRRVGRLDGQRPTPGQRKQPIRPRRRAGRAGRGPAQVRAWSGSSWSSHTAIASLGSSVEIQVLIRYRAGSASTSRNGAS
jgi:hypothetical protein